MNARNRQRCWEVVVRLLGLLEGRGIKLAAEAGIMNNAAGRVKGEDAGANSLVAGRTQRRLLAVSCENR